MLLQCVIHHVVVQERQVVVERDGPAAGAGGRVLVQLLVVREVVEDLVVVGLRLHAGPAAVPEDQLLLRLVAQPQVRHIEVDLLQQAASRLHRDPLPALLASSSFPPSSPTPLPVAMSSPLASRASRVRRSPLSLLPPSLGAAAGL